MLILNPIQYSANKIEKLTKEEQYLRNPVSNFDASKKRWSKEALNQEKSKKYRDRENPFHARPALQIDRVLPA